jgi:hypothetical protein
MGQPNPEMVPVGSNEHLGFMAQPAERDRVDDPIAIALKCIPLAARPPVTFLKNPAARS